MTAPLDAAARDKPAREASPPRASFGPWRWSPSSRGSGPRRSEIYSKERKWRESHPLSGSAGWCVWMVPGLPLARDSTHLAPLE